MFRSPKLWVALGAAGVVLMLAGVNLGTVLPILLIAACPLSMVLMMGGMAGMGRGKDDDAATPSGNDDEVARLRAEVADLRQRTNR